MSVTQSSVGLKEHLERHLDELQLRDRSILQLRGPTEEQIRIKKERQIEDSVKFTGDDDVDQIFFRRPDSL